MFPHTYFLRAMPDESDLSHLGRAFLYSGFKRLQGMITFLLTGVASPNGVLLNHRYGRTIVPLLASGANVDLERYIGLHTLLPFVRALSRPQDIHRPASEHLGQLNRTYAPARFTLRYCEQCRRAQVRACGYSYWLRTHQIPGVYWCHIHGEVLRKVAPGYLNCPPKNLEDSDWLPVETDGFSHPYVQGYYAGVITLLENPEPKDVFEVSQKLVAKLLANGIKHLSNGHQRAEVALQSAAPQKWLHYLRHLELGTTRSVLPLAVLPTQGSYLRVTIPLLAPLVMEVDEIVAFFKVSLEEERVAEPSRRRLHSS